MAGKSNFSAEAFKILLGRYNALSTRISMPRIGHFFILLSYIKLYTMEIYVEKRTVYGNILVYPACVNSQIFCTMLGTATLGYSALTGIAALGYSIIYK